MVVSIYESFTIGAVLECHRKNKGYLKIWYLYVLSTIQFLQVIHNTCDFNYFEAAASSASKSLSNLTTKVGFRTVPDNIAQMLLLVAISLKVINSSINLPIYYFVGSAFKTAAQKILKTKRSHRKSTRNREDCIRLNQNFADITTKGNKLQVIQQFIAE